ncbi:hypothetical protein [Domibacillus robiginosus]|uniref:hypothetical protein n=1 Tax=Domibacillus robiginosus TaxID=1071054 RepID=UPI00067BAA4E|nr:hypothetical protein [Domibacillus robiginosus]
MLQKNTKSIVVPQVYNLAALTVSSFLLAQFVPHLTGSAGAIAASLGEMVRLLVVTRVVFHLQKKKTRILRQWFNLYKQRLKIYDGQNIGCLCPNTNKL